MPWLPIPPDSDFSLHNIPFGIGSTGDEPFACTRVGDQVVNLYALAQSGFFQDVVEDITVFNEPTLNRMIALGKTATNAIRARLQAAFEDPDSPVRHHPEALVPWQQVRMHLPVQVGDYTDFYSSIEHATNVGRMFRDPDNALLPNWRHIPIGYHGRASSIVISGTPVIRPNGQTKAPDAEAPTFGPTKRLDFELEVAFVIGKENTLGQPIPITETEDYIFGLLLFNDWSARDVQQWEYVPLGPFLAKNFASSVSPWIVTLEALEPFRVPGPEQQPSVLPYLRQDGANNFDIQLEVDLTPYGGSTEVISRTNFRYMYWSMRQQLAHHTSNGCNVRVGDLMASGTISGPDRDSLGSMLEMTLGGKQPLALSNGQTRAFVADGDTVGIRGWAEREGIRVGFGEVTNRVDPAR